MVGGECNSLIGCPPAPQYSSFPVFPPAPHPGDPVGENIHIHRTDGRIWRRHTDHLRACNLRSSESSMIEDAELPKDGISIPDRNIAVTPNVKDNCDKDRTLSTNCNVID